jgi:hypothetical protein
MDDLDANTNSAKGVAETEWRRSHIQSSKSLNRFTTSVLVTMDYKL